jgi:hypothetical protein
MTRPASTRALHADALFGSGWQRRATVFKGPEFCDPRAAGRAENDQKGTGMTTKATSPPPSREGGVPAQQDQHSQVRRALISMILPVFFVMGFTLCFVSAFQSPAPHGVNVAIAGPAGQTAPVRAGLSRAVGPAFDVSAVPTAAAAAREVRDQDLYGAYVPATPGKPAATVIVSSASGVTVASTVETLFGAVAARQGAHLAVLDVRPLPAADRTGDSLFFFLVGCSVAGFLTIIATGAFAPALRPRYRWPLILAAAVAIPVLAYLLVGLGLGAISGPAGAIVALLGMGALYVLVVAMIARGLQVILGQAAIIAFLAIFVMLNLPGAGGAISPVLLPTFWHVLSRFWIGGAAFDAFRSIIYFGGQGVGADVLKLLAWFGVGVVLLALPAWRKIGPGAVASPRRDRHPNH